MKRTLAALLALACLFALTAEIRAGSSSEIDDVDTADAADADSTLDVIAWFGSRDTVTYTIRTSIWEINVTDTLMTALATSKVQINVTDSTDAAYSMEYRILETSSTPVADGPYQRLLSDMANKLGREMAGTVIRFDTDNTGSLAEITNLDEINAKAKANVDAIKQSLMSLKEFEEMRRASINTDSVLSLLDADRMTEGYLNEINLLFAYHGYTLPLGETTEHEDATESQYESSTDMDTYIGEDGDSYHIVCNVTSVIPRDNLKGILGGLVEKMGDDSVTASFEHGFDSQVNDNCTVSDYVAIDYLLNGWPYSALRQRITMIGQRGKATQSSITLDSFSF